MAEAGQHLLAETHDLVPGSGGCHPGDVHAQVERVGACLADGVGQLVGDRTGVAAGDELVAAPVGLGGGRRVAAVDVDLAIEIVSRNDKFDYVMEKAGRYRKCGGSLRKTAGRSLSPRIVTSF